MVQFAASRGTVSATRLVLFNRQTNNGKREGVAAANSEESTAATVRARLELPYWTTLVHSFSQRRGIPPLSQTQTSLTIGGQRIAPQQVIEENSILE